MNTFQRLQVHLSELTGAAQGGEQWESGNEVRINPDANRVSNVCYFLQWRVEMVQRSMRIALLLRERSFQS